LEIGDAQVLVHDAQELVHEGVKRGLPWFAVGS